MKKATFYKGIGINGYFWMNQYPDWLNNPEEYNFEPVEVLLPDDVKILKDRGMHPGREFYVGKDETLFVLCGDHEKCWMEGGEYPEYHKIKIELADQK